MSKSITFDTKQLLSMCSMAGIVVDEDKTFSGLELEDFLNTEYTLHENVRVQMDDSQVYEGMAICSTEYPEEGYLTLEHKNNEPTPLKEHPLAHEVKELIDSGKAPIKGSL